MLSIFEVVTFQAALQFVLWVAAVAGLEFALFRSLLGDELRNAWAQHRRPVTERLRLLSLQLDSGVRYVPGQRTYFGRLPKPEDEVVAFRDAAHAQAQQDAAVALGESIALTPELRVDLTRELGRLRRGSLWTRAAAYWLSCGFCQRFLAAFALFLCTRGIGQAGAGFVTALAAAKLCGWMESFKLKADGNGLGQAGRHGGCSR